MRRIKDGKASAVTERDWRFSAVGIYWLYGVAVSGGSWTNEQFFPKLGKLIPVWMKYKTKSPSVATSCGLTKKALGRLSIRAQWGDLFAMLNLPRAD